MADDVGAQTVTKAQALQFLRSITGQSFSDLRDPAIATAMATANMAAGPGGGAGGGSCVYTADGERICQDNVTQEQCENGLGGRWSGLLSCEFRQNELEQILQPVAGPEDAAPARTPPKARRRPAKPAKKKPAKKRPPTRVAKRAPAAARSKPKKKAAAKTKRRVAKAAAKKPKRTTKKAKRR